MASYQAVNLASANEEARSSEDAVKEQGKATFTELDDGRTAAKPTSWRRRIVRFAGLVVTTLVSVLLLVASERHYKTTVWLPHFATSHQATTQLIVQVIANTLAVIQTSVLCELVNDAVRLRLCSHAFTVSALHFWVSLSQARMDWNVRARRLTPLAFWAILMAVPAALWAGAISPVSVMAGIDSNLTIAAYGDLKYLNQQFDNSPSPEVQNDLGFFTYALGDQFSGQLLETARSAVTPTGDVRNHSKIDSTHYVWSGRSYGMGGSVGLEDMADWPSSVHSYAYQDFGYDVGMNCIYNRSESAVTLGVIAEAEGINVYAAEGYLPNSDLSEDPEYMTYVGMGDDKRIIAISVARNPINRDRILSFAAGKTYQNLNMVQCKVDFQPTAFNIAVSVHDRSIIVTPLLHSGFVEDIGGQSYYTNIVLRELGQIPKNVQGWDFSLVGESLNTSIANYQASYPSLPQGLRPRQNFSDTSSYLRGLETTLTAMIDDMLASYAAAQFVVAKDTRQVPVQFQIPAIEFGQAAYIFAIFAVNVVIVLLVVVQAYFTRLWHDLPDFDCLDPSSIILTASKGGTGLTEAVDMVGKNQVSMILDRHPSDRLVLC